MRLSAAQKKSRPKAALSFDPDDGRSGGRQGWLRLPAIGHEANASEGASVWPAENRPAYTRGER
jgi:hypothetical protein